MSLLTRIFHVLGVDDAPDPAWKPTGYTYRHTGHDETLGRASSTRAAQLAESKRKIEAIRSRPWGTS